MCQGCFNQLLLRDEFHSGGMAGLLGKAAGMPTRRAIMAYSVGAASVLSAVGAVPAFAADEGADVILRGGTIRPLPGAAVASALAIKGGKVLAVGDESALSSLKTANTKVVDLAGRMLLPGLIDPHCHTLLASLIFELLDDVGFAKYATREKVVAHLKEAAASTPKGQWIVGSNFDNLLQGGEFTRAQLDAISSDHPMFVWYTNGHALASTAKRLKSREYPKMSAICRVAVTSAGAPTASSTAWFTRKARCSNSRCISSARSRPRSRPRRSRIIPSTWVPSATRCCTSPARSARTGSSSLQRSRIRLPADQRERDVRRHEGPDTLAQPRPRTERRDRPESLFSLYGVKIVGDGSNQTETGAQTKPYLNSTSKGSPNFDAALMKQMVAEIKAFGLPVLIHSNGDYTIDIALDAIEAAYAGSTDYGINRIEHATMARPDQILRMKKLNVQPSFLINPRALLRCRLSRPDLRPRTRCLHGPRRAACVKAGLPFTLHTDGPCSPLISTAVTRRCIIDNSVVGPDQAVSLDNAIRAVTIDAARQIGQGDRLGWLEKGKEADFTILESDPYKVSRCRSPTSRSARRGWRGGGSSRRDGGAPPGLGRKRHPGPDPVGAFDLSHH